MIQVRGKISSHIINLEIDNEEDEALEKAFACLSNSSVFMLALIMRGLVRIT